MSDDRDEEIVVFGPGGRRLNRRTYRSIQVMARKVIADLVEDGIGDRWESYPEIGEHDWAEVVQEAESLLRRLIQVDPEVVRTAYAVLEARAGGDA